MYQYEVESQVPILRGSLKCSYSTSLLQLTFDLEEPAIVMNTFLNRLVFPVVVDYEILSTSTAPVPHRWREREGIRASQSSPDISS